MGPKTSLALWIFPAVASVGYTAPWTKVSKPRGPSGQDFLYSTCARGRLTVSPRALAVSFLRAQDKTALEQDKNLHWTVEALKPQTMFQPVHPSAEAERLK